MTIFWKRLTTYLCRTAYNIVSPPTDWSRLYNVKHPDVLVYCGRYINWIIIIITIIIIIHIISTAAKHAAAIKTAKWSNTSSTHIFYPIFIDTAGSWDVQAAELMEEIGRWTTAATNDQNGTTYLFQRISMAIQRGNSMAIQRGNSMAIQRGNSMAIQRGNAL